MHFNYDNLDRVSSMVDGLGTTTYAYDALARLQSVGSTAGTFSYGYLNSGVDSGSGLIRQLTAPSGALANYAYSSLQQLATIQTLKSDATTNLAKYTYAYDARELVTSATRKEGSVAASTVTYGYDLGHQIISEASNEAAPLLSATYAYDGMGNPTTFTDHAITATYSVNSANQITATSATGNISSTLTYNGGNLTQNQGSGNGAGTATYTYDGANRLTQIVNTNASGTNLTKSVFTYDGLSRRRIAQEYTWTNGAWALSSELRFIYAGMNLLQTRNGSNAVQAQYTWGAGMGGGIGGLLARTVGTPSHHYYYHYDGGGNVVALTNSSQQVVARYQYGAYGNIVSSGLVSGDATLTDSTDLAQQNANPFRFSTKWQHSASGLYDYGFRFYSPGLGRFINRDPIRERGGVNLYGFVGNNPINHVDPYGLYIGDWIDEHIFMGSVSDFGDAYGWYDNGCGSGWRVAGLGGVAAGKTIALAFLAAAGGATATAAAGDAAAGLGIAGAAGAANNLPTRLARVVPANYLNSPTLAGPHATEAFVTPAEDIAGLSSAEAVAQRLTLIDANGALLKSPKAIIEFDNPITGLASPVFRSNPGFIQGGLTQGGAREFVIPNHTVSSLPNVTTRIVR